MSDVLSILQQVLRMGGTNPLRTPATPDNSDYPVRQNFMLPEPGTDNYFGRHPGMTRGIENAFMMASQIGPTRTAGEAIQQIASAALGLRPMRQRYAAEQLMIPLQWQEMEAKMRQTRAQTAKDEAEARLKGFEAQGYEQALLPGGPGNPEEFAKAFQPGGMYESIGKQYPDLAQGAIGAYQQGERQPNLEKRIAHRTQVIEWMNNNYNQRERNRINEDRENRLENQGSKPSFDAMSVMAENGWKPEDVLGNPTVAKQFNAKMLDRQEHIAGARAQGGFGTHVSEQGLSYTHQNNQGRISEINNNLKRLDSEDMDAIDPPASVTAGKKGKELRKASDAWKEAEKSRLTQERDSLRDADSTYEHQLLINPSLTFDQHLSNIRAKAAAQTGKALKYNPNTGQFE